MDNLEQDTKVNNMKNGAKQRKTEFDVKGQFSADVYSEELFDLLKERDGLYSFYEMFFFEFDMFDDIVGTFLPGDLMLITSDKPIGKTSLILNSIANDSVDFNHYVFFSLDTKRFRVFEKLIRILTKFNTEVDCINNPDMAKKRVEAIEELKAKPLFVYDKPNTTIGDMYAFLTVKNRYAEKAPVVFVDSLQLISKTDGQKDIDIVIALKNMAKDLGVPLIATCKPIEGMEQIADVVVCLKEGNEGAAKEGISYFEAQVIKNRNGYTGSVYFKLDKRISKLYQLDGEIAV